jgi:hypothetical protein
LQRRDSSRAEAGGAAGDEDVFTGEFHGFTSIISLGHYRQIGGPGADFLLVPFGHDAADLNDVREVVRGPGGDQLAHGDGAEGGVGALEIELIGTKIERDETGEAGMAGGGEFVEELWERLAGAIAKLGFAVEGFEGPGGSVLENDFQARDPVCVFAVDEVADDDLRAPGAGAFGGVGPTWRACAPTARWILRGMGPAYCSL